MTLPDETKLNEIFKDPGLAALREADFDQTNMSPETHAAIKALRRKYLSETKRLSDLLLLAPLFGILEQLAWSFLAGAAFDEKVATERINFFIDECEAAITVADTASAPTSADDGG